MKPSLALTGATGLVGREFRRRFEAHVTATFSGDICNGVDVESFCSSLRDVDCLIHLAAVVPRQTVDTDPERAYHVNCGGTLRILEALKRLKDREGRAPRLLYASSSHVYAASDRALKEADELTPLSAYGLTKLQGEQWCRHYRDNHRLSIAVVRIFSFSGPGQSFEYFIPATVQKVLQAERNSEVRFQGVRGSRDFLHVAQVAEGLFKLAQFTFNGEINLATGVGLPLTDVIRRVVELAARSDLRLNFGEDPPVHLVADVQKLNSEGLEFRPQLDRIIHDVLSQQQKVGYGSC
jgi:nucleoside-diphosphate-sugar epimerase